MKAGYFHRVNTLSPTRFWINNPTLEEAEKAIAAGAINCTTNPTYAMKQIQRERDYALGVVDEVIKEIDNNDEAAAVIQRRLTKRILDTFLALSEKNPGKEGFVSIQGDPILEDDPEIIIAEALQNRTLGKNYLAKIPSTKAGLKAMESLIPEDIPIIATEGMGISQAVHVAELYSRVSRESGISPALFITHITGIFDDHMRNVVARENIEIAPDILWQAGCIIARKQYTIFQERHYPGVMLGGGARGLHHFTEMVGSEMHITINWKGTADKLIESDPPVVYRMETPAPQYVIDELLEKIPDFRKAYFEDELSPEEFGTYGPVELFRSAFIKGWEFLLNTIEERRALLD